MVRKINALFNYLLVVKKSFYVLLLNWITFQGFFSLGLQRGEEKHY